MSRQDFVQVLDQLAASEVFFVNISGGEPFMHPEIVDFLQIAHTKFKHVMTLTNGTRLREEHIDAIRKIIKQKGVFTVQVSLDSVDPAINSKTRTRSSLTMRNIMKLSSIGASVIVATVVTKYNFKSVYDTIDNLSKHIKCFHLMSVQDVRRVEGIEKDHCIAQEKQAMLWRKTKELAEQRGIIINTPLNYEGDRGCAEGAPCMAAFSHIVIDPSMKVRPCDRLVDVIVGDLRKSTIGEIWNGSTVKPILESPVPLCRLNNG